MDKQKIRKILPVAGAALLLLGLIVWGLISYVNQKQPVISLRGDATVVIEYGEDYTEPGVEAYSVNSQGKTQPLHHRVSGKVGTEPGIYVLNYTAGVLGERATVTRTVIVQDTTAPEIRLQGASTVTLAPGEVYVEEGFTATDNHDGDIAGRVTVKLEHDGYLYEVTDEAGNTASVLRAVRYTQLPPTIELSGGDPLYIPASVSGYADPGYYAEDSLDGDLTSQVQIEGHVNSHRAGSYSLTYSVTDSEGLTATCSREVIVSPVPAAEEVMPEGKIIYLTFDDGPSENTERLLDILDKYDIKATWFATASQEDCLDYLSDIVARGHTVGVHTVTHDYDAIYQDEDAYFRDFKEIQDIILEKTGVLTTLFRFPGGSSNTVSRFNPGIMTALAQDAYDCGLTYFDWNVSSADTAIDANRYTVIENVIEGIQEQDVSVVLQHDIRDYSVDAMEDIIVWALDCGYTFLPLDATSPTFHHEIAN